MEVELEGAMHVIAYMVPSGMREAMEAKYVAEPLLLGYGGIREGSMDVDVGVELWARTVDKRARWMVVSNIVA